MIVVSAAIEDSTVKLVASCLNMVLLVFIPLNLKLASIQRLIAASVPTMPIFFSESAICWSKGKYFWQYSEHSFRKLDKFVEI